jgi:hypothetical protein
LCLDVMHRTEGDALISLHRGLVEECIERLRRLQPSAIAAQGTHLLSVLLTEAKQTRRPSSTSRKRGPPTDPEFRDRMKRSRIKKLTGKPSSNSRATRIERHGVQAQNIDASANSVGDSEQELEPREVKVPQMLPPQAGFSNDFLFNELLDLWM